MAHDPRNPKAMEGFVGNGIHVLESMKGLGIPVKLIEKCAAMVLLSTRQGAFFLTGTKGAGVVMLRRDDSWSLPVPVLVQGAGLGLSLGGADKELLVLLNSKDAEKLLYSNQAVSFGVEFGFAIGKVGKEAGSDILADGGGLARSATFAVSNGLLLNAEVSGSAIDRAPDVVRSFYGEYSDVKSILDGKTKVPSNDEFVAKLFAAANALEE